MLDGKDGTVGYAGAVEAHLPVHEVVEHVVELALDLGHPGKREKGAVVCQQRQDLLGESDPG